MKKWSMNHAIIEVWAAKGTSETIFRIKKNKIDEPETKKKTRKAIRDQKGERLLKPAFHVAWERTFSINF